jgi:hypothetical protein
VADIFRKYGFGFPSILTSYEGSELDFRKIVIGVWVNRAEDSDCLDNSCKGSIGMSRLRKKLKVSSLLHKSSF